MVKRQKNQRQATPSVAASIPTRGESPLESADGKLLPGQPEPKMQIIVSLAIMAHFSILVFALSANLAPSYLQGRISSWLSSYLVTTHQAYDALPIELTHAEALDFPLRVELQLDAADRENWQVMELPGVVPIDAERIDVRRSRWQNFARWFRICASEQPESEILSDIAIRYVRAAERLSGEQYRAIRFISPKVLSYDEDALRSGGISSPDDPKWEPTLVFGGSIVRFQDSQMGLIPFQDPLRTAKPERRGKTEP